MFSVPDTFSEGALRTAVHRLRAEIAETLDDPSPGAIADELQDLFAALGN